jgi:hypothetical protein
MKKIILINGTGGSGKDTFVKMVAGYQEGVRNISSVDMPKEAAKILGWTGGKEEKDRLYLSELKKLWVNYCDGSVNFILNEVKSFKESRDSILFIHIREIEEIIRVKAFINCSTLLVDNGTLITTNESDANVKDYKYDYVINNTGSLEDLRYKAILFVRELQAKDWEKDKHA